MKKIRKVNTKKRKQDRKEAEKRLADQTSLMMNHPTECCVCKKPFERTNETVLSWQVVIRNNTVRLTCPSCHATIQEFVERDNV